MKGNGGGTARTGRLFFDVSSLCDYLRHHGRYSGIQRVVTAISREFSLRAGRGEVYLSWLDRDQDRYVCLDTADLPDGAILDPQAMRAVLLGDDRQPPAILDRYSDRPLRYYYHRTRLDLYSLLGRREAFRRFGTTPDTWRDIRRGGGRRRSGVTDFLHLYAPGDRLVAIDSAWTRRNVETFSALHDRGVPICSFVYDLIPLMANETTTHSARDFHDWLTASTAYTRCYVTISQSVKRELERFFASHGIGTDSPVVALPLAQDALPVRAERAADGERPPGPKSSVYPFVESWTMSEPVRQVLGFDYALCVGTLEKRKNVWRLAMAWKTLADAGETDLPKLVFAGRPGWLRSDFEDLLRGTGNVYGFVHVIHEPSDGELDMLYRHCRFAVMASTLEGWGLPVGEALACGRTALVGDNSSLPEVGGDLVEYCDARSIASIAEGVRRLLDPHRRGLLEERIRNARLRGWSDVAADLSRILARVRQDPPVPGDGQREPRP